jgi:iron(III) transport system substrate-binding protein
VVSVLQGAPHPEAARRFVDFLLSPKAQELFAKLSLTSPVNPQVGPAEGSVTVKDSDLISYNAKLAGDQREAVLSEWQKIVK